jgi:hypothetical protein
VKKSPLDIEKKKKLKNFIVDNFKDEDTKRRKGTRTESFVNPLPVMTQSTTLSETDAATDGQPGCSGQQCIVDPNPYPSISAAEVSQPTVLNN